MMVGRCAMWLQAVALATVLALGLALPAAAADDTKVKAATKQVETGAKKIGEGKIGQGVEETAKGIGNTVVEGAKFSGEKIKEGGEKDTEKTKDAGRAAGQEGLGAGARRRGGLRQEREELLHPPLRRLAHLTGTTDRARGRGA